MNKTDKVNPQTIEAMKHVASHAREMHVCMLQYGFNEDQALELTKVWLESALRPQQAGAQSAIMPFRKGGLS